ncbi:MAG: hypothetical protein KDJ97_18970 [Anaerolineae bacterium]|nr:hypothetical protein [Anaerolineae bacterium]
MILELDYNTLLVLFNRRYSLAEFRAASQVLPGSYADELVERIYNYLFKYPRDVQAEYEKYYAIEYSNFAKFLFWKYGIDKNTALQIKNRANDDVFIGYCSHSMWLLTDETVLSVLDHILYELGENRNENSH